MQPLAVVIVGLQLNRLHANKQSRTLLMSLLTILVCNNSFCIS